MCNVKEKYQDLKPSFQMLESYIFQRLSRIYLVTLKKSNVLNFDSKRNLLSHSNHVGIKYHINVILTKYDHSHSNNTLVFLRVSA